MAFDRLSVASHAHYHLFGSGCPGALGVPVLAPIGQPRPVLSLPLTLGLSNLPTDVGIISMGFSKSVSGGQPLPLDLGAFGLPGCPLLVDPVASTLIVGAAGQASWTLQIPFNRALMGQFFYNQGFALDQAANAAGVTVSNAGGGCIGR